MAIVIRDSRMCAVCLSSLASKIKCYCTTSAETNLLDEGVGGTFVYVGQADTRATLTSTSADRYLSSGSFPTLALLVAGREDSRALGASGFESIEATAQTEGTPDKRTQRAVWRRRFATPLTSR